MVEFDTGHLFRVFDGPRGLLKVLDKHQPDHDITYNAVQMWRARRQISTKRLGVVLYCILQEGHELSEFLIDPDDFA